MKKLLALTLVLILVLAPLSSCAKDTTAVRLGGMTGPTSIGMAKLLADDKAGESANDYDFTLVGDGAQMKTKLLTGEVDIAAIPANLAAALYKATEGKIKILAVNTLGVVSLLEKGDTVSSIADLRGKTVYAPASAAVAIPEIVFTYLLAEAGLTVGEDVQIEWVPTAAGQTSNPLAPKLKDGEIVLSPEPAATALLSAVEGSRRAVSFNDAWTAEKNGAQYVTGVTVVRTEFAEQNPEAIKLFLEEYEASIRFANEKPADTAAIVTEFEILSQNAALIERAIPECNVSFLSGISMKMMLSTYYSLLVPVMPAAFGGEVPDNDIYYIAK